MRCGTKNANTTSAGAAIWTEVSIRAMERALLYHGRRLRKGIAEGLGDARDGETSGAAFSLLGFVPARPKLHMVPLRDAQGETCAQYAAFDLAHWERYRCGGEDSGCCGVPGQIQRRADWRDSIRRLRGRRRSTRSLRLRCLVSQAAEVAGPRRCAPERVQHFRRASRRSAACFRRQRESILDCHRVPRCQAGRREWTNCRPVPTRAEWRVLALGSASRPRAQRIRIRTADEFRMSVHDHVCGV